MSTKRRKRQKQQAQRQQQNRLPAPTLGAPAQHNIYMLLFLVNIVTAFIWQQIFPLFGTIDYLLGFGVGFLAIWLTNRTYGRRAYYLLYFIGYVLWEIVLSNVSLAKLVLQPRPKLNPGIIAIPLTVSSGLEIMILASVITLTPGTISVDLGENDQRQRVLYVHNLTVDDPEAFQRSVKNSFERLLLRVTRGSTS